MARTAPPAPGAAGRRRLLLGFLLLSAGPGPCAEGGKAVTEAAPWLGLAGLGAFHGLNPAMGWLFAVALGLHRRERRIVWLAPLPLPLRHPPPTATPPGGG